jgi:hypothetical protein
VEREKESIRHNFDPSRHISNETTFFRWFFFDAPLNEAAKKIRAVKR